MTSRKSVLVVDDSWLILEMVQAALEAEGYEVRTAQDLAALEARRGEATPDLVILDVQMPEAFGDELGETMREIRNVRAPMLLFSSLPDDELTRRARNAGLDGWVSKKSGMRALIERVRAVLGASS